MLALLVAIGTLVDTYVCITTDRESKDYDVKHTFDYGMRSFCELKLYLAKEIFLLLLFLSIAYFSHIVALFRMHSPESDFSQSPTRSHDEYSEAP